MSTRSLLVLGTLAVLPSIADAAVWRVNNTTGNPYDADFTSLSFAVQSQLLSDGDTLHIEASADNYGSATLTRPLVLIGPGFHLGTGVNDNAGLQANGATAKVNAITFGPNSDGSVVEGLVFTQQSGGVQVGNVNNVVIQRNKFESLDIVLSGPDILNVSIIGNYIVGDITCPQFDQNVSGLLIANNYIAGVITWAPGDMLGAIVTHNVILAGSQLNFHNATVTNNVMLSGTLVLNNNVITNNVAVNTQPWDLADSNVNNEALANIFVNSGSLDAKWQVLPAYQTFGTNGSEVGMYGGAAPYALSGIPNIPTIYQLTAPGTAIQGETINVTLSTRSNN